MPVSPTYSFGHDLGRLGYALDLTRPSLVYAGDAARYAPALEFVKAKAPGTPTIAGAEFSELLRDVDEASGRGTASGNQRRHDCKDLADLGIHRTPQRA